MKRVVHNMHQSVSLAQGHKDRVDLLQFTDTHICPGPDQFFDGVDTEKTLVQVIAHARKFHWPPDAVLVTGDLVHEPAPSAYERLNAILKTMARPVFCVPGNHDDPVLIHGVLGAENISTARAIIFNHWICVMLDTFLPESHAGCLSITELGFLDQALTEHGDKHALICLHHPPVSVGSPWMDRMGLQNPAGLFSIVDRHPQVRGILWGHIHQEFNSARNTVQLMATPSTCVQFTPKADGYIKADKPPAYRYLQLHASGEIGTRVININDGE